MINRIWIVTLLAAVLLVTSCGSARSEGSPKPAKPVWAAIGDSITAGVGTTDPWTKAYPIVTGVPARGRSGQGITFALWWPPMVETLGGDLIDLEAEAGVNSVVLEIGINDLRLGHPDKKLFRAYRTLIRICEDAGVRVVLSTITPFGRGFESPGPASLRDMQQQRIRVNTWIRNQGEFVDYAKALGGKWMLLEFDSGDHLHPGDVGAARMAATLSNWINLHGRD